MSISFGLLILRVVVGLTLAGHGGQKLFGWWGGSGMTGWIQVVIKLRIRPATPWAWIAALSEFGGGLLFAFGLLSPLGSLAIIGAMLVAIATVHWTNGFWNGKRGYEFNLVLLAAVFAVAITGPGSYSLDQALGIHLPEPLTLVVGLIAVVGGVVATLASRSPKVETQAKPQTT
ncbi:MAG TPA: DoxX family protein [Candidatus Dormibacteraeota bacterium]|nr:DoxX family protein [Candidatus Dormibacteraeota bacterium]